MVSAAKLIARFGLTQLPVEGGYYAQTYRAEERIPGSCLPRRYGSSRPLATAILYLLSAEERCFSALHRLSSDEVWHS